MVAGIFQTCLVLMAIISMKLPSGKNGISPEDSKEIIQRMKEREVILQQHQLRLEKEIADLEARQESLAWPLWELERNIQLHTCTVFCLVVPAMFVIWRQHRNGAPEEGTEESDLGLLGKAWKGVAFLAKPFVLLRVIADGLIELPLKLLGSCKKILGA